MKKKKEAKQDFLLETFLEPVPVEYHDDFEQILAFTQKVCQLNCRFYQFSGDYVAKGKSYN